MAKFIDLGLKKADDPIFTEGIRFMGYTLYDPLVAWDLSSATAPAKLVPGGTLMYRGTRTVTSADCGPIVNTATVSLAPAKKPDADDDDDGDHHSEDNQERSHGASLAAAGDLAMAHRLHVRAVFIARPRV